MDFESVVKMDRTLLEIKSVGPERNAALFYKFLIDVLTMPASRRPE
jgi:hypothetical protein